ncbi:MULTISPECIES: hypothetical protein [unclassified Novosphingobium]|uniref:hypothetical protein n=1 Tax=unclassified Novosphingobium TaxID=2644732 RepID=UPI0025EC3A86|nr:MULTISPECIES: hypothetical protein [unclassified Novosphingobium]HQV02733.1 hypothetical protein [Novosphingobium sp.]
MAIGAAAVLLASVQLAEAQVATRNTAGTAPADSTQTGTKVTPEQVIKTLDALSKLVKKKPPATTATPLPTPTPEPTATAAAGIPTAPATVTPLAPAPRPSPTPTARPASTQPQPAAKPAPVASKPAATAIPIPLPLPSAPATPDTPDPPPPAIVAPPPILVEPPPPPPERSPLPWALIGGLLAAAAAIGTALYRWFWPKLVLSCTIETGPGNLGTMSTPLVSAPEATFDLRIEVGQASPPRGNAILGEPA